MRLRHVSKSYPWLRPLVVGALSLGLVSACAPKTIKKKADDDKNSSSEDEDSQSKDSENNDSQDENSSSEDESEDSKDSNEKGDDESSETNNEDEDSNSNEESSESDSEDKSSESEPEDDESNSGEGDSGSGDDNGNEDPDKECKVTAQWGSGTPWAAGTAIPNWEIETVFDQNGDGEISGDELTAKKITMEDVYCATPRNKFVILTHSSDL